MEKIDWQKDYAEGWQIFDAILANSGWGKSKSGGPVWVMDVRYENVALLLPDHPWLPLLQLNDSKCHCWLNIRFHCFIDYYGLGNVLLMIGTEVLFWSAGEFLQLIAQVCDGGRVFYPEKSDDNNIYTYFSHIPSSYPYLCVGNSGISKNDITYYPLLHDSENVAQFQKVLVVDGVENYLPILVYDLMESISLSVNNEMHVAYPKMRYKHPDKLWYFRGHEVALNAAELSLENRRWHCGFVLKRNWVVYN